MQPSTPTRTRSLVAGLAALTLAVATVTTAAPTQLAAAGAPGATPSPGLAVAAMPAPVPTSVAPVPTPAGPLAATLSLSDSRITMVHNDGCGPWRAWPELDTATVTVVNQGGAPAAGLDVTFAVEGPLRLTGPAVVSTGADGVAQADVAVIGDQLPWTPGSTLPGAVRATVGGHEAAGSPAGISVEVSYPLMPAPARAELVPLETPPGKSDVPVRVQVGGGCTEPRAYLPVTWSVTGSASLSGVTATLNGQGHATVVVHDSVAETVTLTAQVQGYMAATTTLTFGPTPTASPTPDPTHSPTPLSKVLAQILAAFQAILAFLRTFHWPWVVLGA